MEKKNLDWKHIGFAYHTTDYRYVADYKDGKWQEGYMSDSPNIVRQSRNYPGNGYSNLQESPVYFSESNRKPRPG